MPRIRAERSRSRDGPHTHTNRLNIPPIAVQCASWQRGRGCEIHNCPYSHDGRFLVINYCHHWQREQFHLGRGCTNPHCVRIHALPPDPARPLHVQVAEAFVLTIHDTDNRRPGQGVQHARELLRRFDPATMPEPLIRNLFTSTVVMLRNLAE